MKDRDLKTPWCPWSLISGWQVERARDRTLDDDIVSRPVKPGRLVELTLHIVDSEQLRDLEVLSFNGLIDPLERSRVQEQLLLSLVEYKLLVD